VTSTIVVAINPSASFGRGEVAGPAVVAGLRDLGHTVTELTTESYADLLFHARAAVAERPDALVVVGGDGMVGLGTNLVAGTTIPLGIIPTGTGNDVARGLRIPLGDTGKALEVLVDALARPPRVIDAVLVKRPGHDDRWFAGVLSAGFDAVVNERANGMAWPRGKSRYTIALLRELATLKPITYRFTLDGVSSESPAVLVSVGNNTSIGGGMLVTPNAVLDDGLLDVLVVRPLSRLEFIRIFPRVFSGTHITDPRVTIHRVQHLTIDAPDVVAYADGERVGSLPIEIQIVPAALNVLAPQ
jgi:diacylglycerol kinase (ATP)